MQPVHHKLIQIFRAGTHTPGSGIPITFDNSALESIATLYNTGISKAPLVLGHPADNKPAFGEVRALIARAGKLYAHAMPNQELMDMVRGGFYKNVSASFYAPSHPSNPMPGMWFLRHLGFLGAHPPAVNGMEPLSFSEPNTLGFLDFTEGSDSATNRNLNAIKQFRAVCPQLGVPEAARLLGLCQ